MGSLGHSDVARVVNDRIVGIVQIEAAGTVAEVTARFRDLLSAKGVTIFAVIDQAAAARTALFGKLTGGDATGWDQDCGTATSARLTIIALAPVITAYEHAMTDGEKRAELRLIQHSARRDIGISAGQEGCRFLWPERDRWSAWASCARPLLTQQCCI